MTIHGSLQRHRHSSVHHPQGSYVEQMQARSPSGQDQQAPCLSPRKTCKWEAVLMSAQAQPLQEKRPTPPGGHQ